MCTEVATSKIFCTMPATSVVSEELLRLLGWASFSFFFLFWGFFVCLCGGWFVFCLPNGGNFESLGRVLPLLLKMSFYLEVKLVCLKKRQQLPTLWWRCVLDQKSGFCASLFDEKAHVNLSIAKCWTCFPQLCLVVLHQVSKKPLSLHTLGLVQYSWQIKIAPWITNILI